MRVKNLVRRTNGIGRKCAGVMQGLLNLLETQAPYLDSLRCSWSGQKAEKSREPSVLARMAALPAILAKRLAGLERFQPEGIVGRWA